MKKVGYLLVVAALAIAPLAALAAEAPVKTLHRLFDQEWERLLRENPELASYWGDARYGDRWSDLTLAAIEASHGLDRKALAQLARIRRDALPPLERVNYDLFRRQYEVAVQGHRFRDFLMPISAIGWTGFGDAGALADALPFNTVRAYEDWIKRLNTHGDVVQQTIELMRQGLREGRVPPRVTMARIPAQIEALAGVAPEQHPFYAPFRRFQADMPHEQQNRLKAAGWAAIDQSVIPAYRTFAKFFNDEYLPACRDTIAASALPDGAAYYAWRVRDMTTTDLAPEAIHEIGLREVARIRAQMETVREQVGFRKDLAAFFKHLRTDRRFFYDNPDDLLAAYRAISKKVDPELVRLFGRLPRAPYGVKPIPDAEAPNNTTAYYREPSEDGLRPGWYYVNLYKPETRPKWEMEALTVHEAVPGHHLQLALAQELGELPKFRRLLGFTAFVEGWGLYAESLGGELGLYQDPYSKFGQLTYEMWRAVRLVVDTGIHHKGWSRQQAIDFFRSNAAKTDNDIAVEVDRYISWPGQALAYKIGELKIKELRARAADRLGERFDVRAFHDTVLGAGAVPLDVLERNVDEWIARQVPQTARKR